MKVASLLVLVVLLAVRPFSRAAEPIVIGIAGDSTVADYAPGSPQRGWGQFLAGHFDSGVTVINLAKNGHSTKTFLSEGLWPELIAKKPDLILIQFGHNDSHTPDHPEHTDPQGDYKTLLTRFVAEARAAGATPILVTPVQRRTEVDSLLPYATAMAEVARDQKVTLIDLHALSGDLYRRLGPEKTEALAMPKDKTHFSAAGARQICELVAPALIQAVPALQAHAATAQIAGSPVLFPTAGATGVPPDMPLTLAFLSPVSLGHSGTVIVRDAASHAVVETIDLGQPTAVQTIGGIPGFNYYPVTVEGTLATLHLKNGSLAYRHSYEVELPAGAFAVGGAPTPEGIFWRFSTRANAPQPGKAKLVVATDGSGDFATVQGALDSIPDANPLPRTVLIRKGTYTEIVAFANKQNVTVMGENRKETVIAYPNNQKFNPSGGNPFTAGATPSAEVHKEGHIYHRGVFLAHRVEGLVLANLTIRNTTAHGGSQAEAIILNGTLEAKAIVRDVDLFSFQDTLQINGQAFIQDSYIEGDVDFLWGTGPSFFSRCTFMSVKSDAYYTQIRNPATNHGFVFDHCSFVGHEGVVNDYLSRIEPNRFPASEVVLLNCIVGSSVAPVGWYLQEPKGTTYPSDRLHFWEDASVDPKGALLDVAQRLPVSRQLTSATDAATLSDYAKPAYVLGGWNPEAR